MARNAPGSAGAQLSAVDPTRPAGGALLPETGQTWEVDSALRRAGGRWRVFNAEWREGF